MKRAGKTYAITGAASGLGLATTKALHAEGANVALLDRDTKGEEIAAELGERAFFVQIDVTDEKSVGEGFAKIMEKFKALHGCINCAGIGMAMTTIDKKLNIHQPSVFDFIMKLNTYGTFYGSAHAASCMAKCDAAEDGSRGVIINVASVAGIEGQKGQMVYGASKGAVIGMTVPMARDLARYGIRVMTIAPGIIDTPLMRSASPKVQQGLLDQVAAPKRFGHPELPCHRLGLPLTCNSPAFSTAMKFCVASVCLLALLASAPADASSAPVGKVLEMLSELTVKITEEGKASKVLFEEKTEWCEDNVAKTEFAIKTGKTEVAELTATIQKTNSQITAFEAEIEKKSADIATDEADLTAATKVRETEESTFTAEEKELTETIGTLERAISILSREMNGGASMLQLKNAQNIVQALDVMVQASAFSTADASRLTALMQSSQESSDGNGDEELGAPAGAVYTSHSGGIVGTLQDLLEKAEGQLDSARKAEMSSTHNYEMLKQSLTDEIKFASNDLDAAKTGLAASKEAKASAEGDLSTTSNSLSEDTTDLEDMKEDCLTATETYEAEVKSRDAELAAIGKAKEVIQEAIPGSALNQVSFMQLSRMRITSGKDLVNFEVVHFVRDLGRKHGSAALTQLSSKIASVIRLGSADPFAKVKGLIEDMIAKLEDEASADATKNDWCIKETAVTTEKKEELEAEVEKLSTKISKTSAKAASLKEEVADLQKELAGIAKAEADADAMRVAEKAKFDKDSEETKTAIEGVKTALQVLKEYYASDKAHAAAEGAGDSIISLLEVCESDFSKALAEMTVAETTAAAEYEKMKKENKLTVATKEQDVKYKAKEAAALAKTTAELQGDLETVESELSAVVESLASITQQCTSKVETYAEKKAAREAEIAGLKEALTILEQQTVLLETKSRRMLRGKA